MKRAIVIVALLIVACSRELPNAVVTVEDPDGVAAEAVELGVGPNLDELTKKDLDGHAFPVTFALSTEKRRYEGEVWVVAYSQAGVILARGVSRADIHEDNPSTVLVTLARPCERDIDCDDGIFCNGAETCGDRSCVKPEEPCHIGAFACVTSACIEAEQRCSVAVDHSLCLPITAADGTETPTYCDPATGCAPGKFCYTENDCQDTSFCNGRERCESGRCIGGLPPDISDDNECNIDACIEPEGAVHLDDPNSDERRCTHPAISDYAICLDSTCRPSICGDRVVDARIEDCEDTNNNPSDACHQCRATLWVPSVIAGLGEAGGDPKEMALNWPIAAAVNTRGDLFVAESIGGRILRIDSTENLAALYAGTGTELYSGDYGPAIAADIGFPVSIAADGAGHVYFLDHLHQVVRRIDAETGIITTVAGGGNDPASVDVAATAIKLTDAKAIAVDGLSNLFIGEAGQVIQISGETNVVDEVYGGFMRPVGLAVDPIGDVWIADDVLNEVHRIELASLFSEVVLTSELVNSPSSVAVDRDGVIYVAQGATHQVLAYDIENGTNELYAGTGDDGSSGDGGLARDAKISPDTIAMTYGGDLIIVESAYQRVRRIDRATGVINTVAGNGIVGPSLADGAATSLPFFTAFGGIAISAGGTLYFSDVIKRLVLGIDPQTGTLTVAAGETAAINPGVLAFDATGDLYFAEPRLIRKIDGVTRMMTTVAGNGTAGSCADGAPATGACFGEVSAIAFDRNDRLYVADASTGRIHRVELAAGSITRVAEGLNAPLGMAFDAAGDLYFAERGAHRVRKLALASGTLSTVAGTGTGGYNGDIMPATSAMLQSPTSVLIDRQGRLVIADRENDRVRRVELNGNITTVAGTGLRGTGGDGGPAGIAQLFLPAQVVLGPADELYVYCENMITASVRRIDDATGVITTYAGDVDPQGDGELARSRLGSAVALALVGGTADRPIWWIADGGTGRVREVDTAVGTMASVAGYPQGSGGENVAARYSRLLEDPAGIAFDTVNRYIYVAERDGHVIRRINYSVDPPTISTYAGQLGIARFVDGPITQARFYSPAGLTYDPLTKQLYVADSGNHVIRVIETAAEIPSVRTIAGTPGVRGFSGDGGDARDALLDTPMGTAIAANGGIYVSDSFNHRVRRILANGSIETIFGDGEAASSGSGSPARFFPVKSPTGLVIDRYGNLFVTSPETIRRVSSGDDNIATGDDEVTTVFGAPPRMRFPDAVSRCLTGLALVNGRGDADATDLWVLDACQGFLIRLARTSN